MHNFIKLTIFAGKAGKWFVKGDAKAGGGASDNGALNSQQVIEFEQRKCQSDRLAFCHGAFRIDKHSGCADIFNNIAKNAFPYMVLGNNERRPARRAALILGLFAGHGKSVSTQLRIRICP